MSMPQWVWSKTDQLSVLLIHIAVVSAVHCCWWTNSPLAYICTGWSSVPFTPHQHHHFLQVFSCPKQLIPMPQTQSTPSVDADDLCCRRTVKQTITHLPSDCALPFSPTAAVAQTLACLARSWEDETSLVLKSLPLHSVHRVISLSKIFAPISSGQLSHSSL